MSSPSCSSATILVLITSYSLHPGIEDLHLTSEEFDEIGAEITQALDHFDVPQREKQEVLAAVVAGKDEVINP